MSVRILLAYEKERAKFERYGVAIAAAPLIAIPPVGAAVGVLAGVGLIGFLGYELFQRYTASSPTAILPWSSVESQINAELEEIKKKLNQAGLSQNQGCYWVFSSSAIFSQWVNETKSMVRTRRTPRTEDLTPLIDDAAAKAIQYAKERIKNNALGNVPGILYFYEIIVLVQQFFEQINQGKLKRTVFDLAWKSLNTTVKRMEDCIKGFTKRSPFELARLISTALRGVVFCIRKVFSTAKFLSVFVATQILSTTVQKFLKVTGLDETAIGSSLNWFLQTLSTGSLPVQVRGAPAPNLSNTLTVQRPNVVNANEIRLISLTLPGTEYSLKASEFGSAYDLSIQPGVYRVFIRPSQGTWYETEESVDFWNAPNQGKIQIIYQGNKCEISVYDQNRSLVQTFSRSLIEKEFYDIDDLFVQTPPRWENRTSARAFIEPSNSPGTRMTPGEVPEGNYTIYVENSEGNPIATERNVYLGSGSLYELQDVRENGQIKVKMQILR